MEINKKPEVAKLNDKKIEKVYVEQGIVDIQLSALPSGVKL